MKRSSSQTSDVSVPYGQADVIYTYSGLLSVVQTEGLYTSLIFNMFKSVDERNSDITALQEAR
jgi:hypothetical protein